MEENGMSYEETTSLEDAMPKLDILYMTRIQRERFADADEYLRLKDSYILTPDKLIPAKADLTIMHPLPRVNEISTAIDDDPRAGYFRQALNGKFIRMALILKLLDEAQKNPGRVNAVADGCAVEGLKCQNVRCITTIEQELDHKFKLVDAEKGVYRCIYCEAQA